MIPAFKLSFFVPESHLEQVKEAIFDAGAGRLGNYDQACWQTKGEGQFRPLPEANPAIGERLQLTRVVEYKVETICSAESITQVIKALKEAHPYEEPGYDVLRLEQV